jgi:hypothetical protein
MNFSTYLTHPRRRRNPAEVPSPDLDPEIKPGKAPENPVMPEEDPEIVPEKEPEEPGGPSPAEIPPSPPGRRN